MTDVVAEKSLKDRMFDGEGIKVHRRVIVAFMRTEDTEVVVEWLLEQYANNASFKIEDHGTFYRVDCEEGFEIDVDEIESRIGREYNCFDFMANLTTTMGRCTTIGNKIIITTSLLGLEEQVPDD
jgi:hypothetical protein